MIEVIFQETIVLLVVWVINLACLLVAFSLFGRLQCMTVHDVFILIFIRCVTFLVIIGSTLRICDLCYLLYQLHTTPHLVIWKRLFG